MIMFKGVLLNSEPQTIFKNVQPVNLQINLVSDLGIDWTLK